MSGADLADYSQYGDEYKNVFLFSELNQDAEKLRLERPRRKQVRDGCTKFGQGAVDGVHSIENARVAGGEF
ncbi:MAG: hypothetical protein WAO10_01920 [Candidatus Sulfotelmatobacter sp.]